MDRACSTHVREAKSIKKHWSDSLKGKRQLGRNWPRWEDNIKMDLREIGREGVDWIYQAQDRDQWWAVVKTVMNLRVP
jgi:hypothetical protein